MLVCNARILDNPLTGVPRYVQELTSRFGDGIELIKPHEPRSGVPGHLWEQFVLPVLVGKRLLWSPSITGPLAVRRQVVTVHDTVPLDHPEWLNPRFAAWYRFLTPRLVRRVRGILVVSEFTKQRLIYHCPDAAPKIKVVLSAADRRFAPADEASILSASRSLGIPTPHYLLAVGSLEPRKNLPRLLQAWEQIEGKIPQDIWLVIAGAKGRVRVFGDNPFQKLPPRVHLTGYVADDLLPALYSGALAAAYISLYEGFGFPALEAMACGTPLLTSSVSSLPEVVGDAAIKINPLDVEAIGDGLKRLIEDSGLRSRLSSLGLAQARRFNWDKTAGETWQVLQEAAGER
jgi:glycosyltransferase involved in cell wall biosynthesis